MIVVLDEDGEEVWTRNIDNDPATLAAAIVDAGPDPEVVIEATWGWYWATDVIADAGGTVHLAHPLGIAGFENRRVKTDKIDARLEDSDDLDAGAIGHLGDEGLERRARSVGAVPHDCHRGEQRVLPVAPPPTASAPALYLTDPAIPMFSIYSRCCTLHSGRAHARAAIPHALGGRLRPVVGHHRGDRLR